MSMMRTRWAAVGAAVAVTLGAGGLGLVRAATPSGSESVFVPITPCRVLDTREGDLNVGDFDEPIGADAAITVDGSGGECAEGVIPDEASGLALNVTAINPTEPTFLTLFETGVDRPNSSNLNPFPGEPPTPNAVTTDLSPTGEFDVYNLQGEVDVAIDVSGYYIGADVVLDTAKSVVVTSEDAATPVSVPTGSDVVVVDASMTAPGPGTVVAEAVGTASLDGPGTLSCSLSTTTAANDANAQSADSAGTESMPIALLDTFTVAADDAVTISLVCAASAGTGSMTNPQLVLTFVPDQSAVATTTPTTTTA